jgi:hypothetical protein
MKTHLRRYLMIKFRKEKVILNQSNKILLLKNYKNYKEKYKEKIYNKVNNWYNHLSLKKLFKKIIQNNFQAVQKDQNLVHLCLQSMLWIGLNYFRIETEKNRWCVSKGTVYFIKAKKCRCTGRVIKW